MSKESMMLHVKGNQVLNAKQEPVRLLGVNRAGLEWSANDELILSSTAYALDEWKCNTVRISLSQDRWYGFGPEQRNDTEGLKYRAKFDSIVNAALAREKYIILDLHWNNCNVWGSHIGQRKMPDMNTLFFWKDAARRYRNNPAVLFNLYNEPHDITWDVWLNGGEVDEDITDYRTGETYSVSYTTPGHQKLADAVRAEGASNILIVSGIDYGYHLDGIAQGYVIEDKTGNGVIYDSHIYPWKDLNWDDHVSIIADKHPVMIGEFGHYGDKANPVEGPQCLPSKEWMTRILDWIDKKQYHFAAWNFHPSAGPCLISSFYNEPTKASGVYIKEYLLKQAKKK